MTMEGRCPGADTVLRPTIILKECPECGEEIELFSTDESAKCSKCGFTVYNEVESCLKWCKYAKKCVDEGLYEKIMGNANKEKKEETEP